MTELFPPVSPMKIPTLILVTAAAFAPLALAQEPTTKDTPTTDTASQKLPNLPWHMINLWWDNAGAIEDFQSFSIDVDISTDIPSEKYNLYISPFGGMTINGDSVYGGIQTNCNGWNAMAPSDKVRLHGGKGFIFSRWSEQPDLTLDDVRATPDGFVETAGYEGHFASGRKPYPWTAGKYTYSLRRLDTQMVNGKPHTWVGAFVREHATEKEIFVSALRFEGDNLKHNGKNCCFLEFYATHKLHAAPDLATLPELEVRFSNLRFNDKAADLTKVFAQFIRKDMKRDDGLATPISPNILRATASEDGRSVTCKLVRTPVADKEEPSRALWKK